MTSPFSSPSVLMGVGAEPDTVWKITYPDGRVEYEVYESVAAAKIRLTGGGLVRVPRAEMPA